MELKWTACAMTDQGLRRQENQDEPVFSPDEGLFAVSDGMGGIAYGKRTAILVSTMMKSLAQQLQTLQEGPEALMEGLCQGICDISDNIQRLGNPIGLQPSYGATLTGFLLREDRAVIFNVGDSRVYRLRQGSERLERMTKDHSVVQILIDSGDLTPEEARAFPGRSTITQFMGMHPTVVPQLLVESLAPGDRYLVCSDGLHGMVSDSAIRLILEQDLPPQELCRQLIAAANEAGGEDNITVVVWQALGEEPILTGEEADG